MRVLVAPQEFKGSLTAFEAARAIVRGLKRARPRWQVEVLPLSDGGPGFLSTLAPRVHGTFVRAPCHDALGRSVGSAYVLLERRERVAYVEAAMANGLARIAPGDRDPLGSSTGGVGELVEAAIGAGARRVVVGVGGSATTDGGTGAARTFGARFVDADYRDLPPGGGSLAALAQIEWRPPDWLREVEIVVATDVTNPLTGETGAAVVFGPQKGATQTQVELLGRGLERFARVVRESLGVDMAAIPGGGAAGGLAAGLVVFGGARIVSGFDLIAEITGLQQRIANVDLVITGEGSYDAQSAMGKVTGRVRVLAEGLGKRCVVFAGKAASAEADVATIASNEPDEVQAMEQAATLLEAGAARWASEAQ